MKKLEFELYCFDSDETVLHYPYNYAIDITRQTLDVCGKLEFFTPTAAEALWFRVIGSEERKLFIKKVFRTDPKLFIKNFNRVDKEHLNKCIEKNIPYLFVGADIYALKELKDAGATLVLQTDSPAHGLNYRKQLLEEKEIDFDFTICSGGLNGTIRSKPHPDSINIILEKFQTPPEKACHVGDLVADILMARSVGATPIWRANDRVKLLKSLNSVKKITSITELL